jgi:hypothetical protein
VGSWSDEGLWLSLVIHLSEKRSSRLKPRSYILLLRPHRKWDGNSQIGLKQVAGRSGKPSKSQVNLGFRLSVEPRGDELSFL